MEASDLDMKMNKRLVKYQFLFFGLIIQIMCSCEHFYYIGGNVVDANTLQPISGVEIFINPQAGPTHPYYSDSSGEFYEITACHNNINISLRKEGYEPMNIYYRRIKDTNSGSSNPTIIKLHKINKDSLLLQEK